MKKLSVMAVVALCFPALMAENIRLRDMRSSVNDVTLVCDGRVARGGMNVAYGDILSYRLPLSGLRCSVSFKRFWQFRADENDIHGTIPDVAVRADEALDRALGIIKAGKTK